MINLFPMKKKKCFFIRFNYDKKKFYEISKKQIFDLSKCKFLLIRQDPHFNFEYISTTYILDIISKKVKIINKQTAIRKITEKLN